ncbi:MAG: hypothetical protein IT376_05830 [Polyangiaceae bacterium]|nr:hypothetical protein [Polyangiaceae bacterium]
MVTRRALVTPPGAACRRAVALLLAATAAPAPGVARADAPPPGAAPPVAPAAPAQPDAGAPAPRGPAAPRVHHAPIASAKPGEPLLVRAELEHPHLVASLVVVHRALGAHAWSATPMLRAEGNGWVATVPAAAARAPGLEYVLELERTDGARLPVFATRDEPHPVQIAPATLDESERLLDERVGGRRSVFFASSEYVTFGRVTAALPDSGSAASRRVDDRYWRAEGGYAYRPLRTVTEFRLRLGAVRGDAPVKSEGYDPGTAEGDPFAVGLNYGAPTVRLRVTDGVHVEGEGLVSINQIGFSLGMGGAVLLGDPYGGRLTIGFETVQVFGTRFYSRLDVPIAPGLLLAPMVEVTDMPSAEDYGVRLLGELAMDAGLGLSVTLRGGWQAREATSGGPSAGAGVSYAF